MAFNLNAMLGSSENQIQQIPVDRLVPYYKHPFKLYDGERLSDMVESVRQNGVLVPIIVRPCMGDYEILVGHNRWNASKLAGLAAVPAIVKNGLTEEEAEMYVVESNLMQRGFDNLKISEQAAVVAMRRNQMFSQGKRNDILKELQELEHGSYKPALTADKVGREYGLSRNSVTRLVRIDSLHQEIKNWIDAGLSVRAGVELSFIPSDGQAQLAEYLLERTPETDTNYDIIRKLLTEKRAKQLRQAFADGQIQSKTDLDALFSEQKPVQPETESNPEEESEPEQEPHAKHPQRIPDAMKETLDSLQLPDIESFERAIARGEWVAMELQAGRRCVHQLLQYTMQVRYPEESTKNENATSTPLG